MLGRRWYLYFIFSIEQKNYSELIHCAITALSYSVVAPIINRSAFAAFFMFYQLDKYLFFKLYAYQQLERICDSTPNDYSYEPLLKALPLGLQDGTYTSHVRRYSKGEGKPPSNKLIYKYLCEYLSLLSLLLTNCTIIL